MRTDVSISVRKINDRVNAIDIGGELTSFAEDDLTEAIDQANVEDISCILLNFRDLTYMNSSAGYNADPARTPGEEIGCRRTARSLSPDF
jgi:hypothetical protein